MKKFSKVVVSAIVRQGDSILVVKRNRDFKGMSMGKDLWEIPGGTVEFGEELLEALRREVKEETAIHAGEDIQLTAAVAYTISDNTTKAYRVNLIYSMELPEQSNIALSEEHAEYQFIRSTTQLNALDILPGIKTALADYMKSR